MPLDGRWALLTDGVGVVRAGGCDPLEANLGIKGVLFAVLAVATLREGICCRLLPLLPLLLLLLLLFVMVGLSGGGMFALGEAAPVSAAPILNSPISNGLFFR